MFTRNRLISSLKCYGCDHELTPDEVKLYPEYNGMCEECYTEAMEAAYEGDYFDCLDDFDE